MRKLLVGCCVAMLCIAGCSNDQGKGLMETAQFEEKQNNREHAVQLYEEIVRKYPGSENAQKAEERLAELKKAKQ